MTAINPGSHYALGYTGTEHERLIRQAARYARVTARLFQEAGIGRGQRVLDLGSGVGDVAMLVARLVGPSGEVVGIERDAGSIALARSRVAETGLSNITFVQSDVSQPPGDKPFDAVIGRFILQFLPDPSAVLRSQSQLVHSGGVIAFQEISWAPLLKLTEHLPLWSACASLCCDTLRRSGAKTDMGLALHRVFLDAGLPTPTLNMELLLGNDQDLTRWIYDIFQSVRPQIAEHGLNVEALGDLEALQERLHAEIVASKGVISSPGLVGAWCRV